MFERSGSRPGPGGILQALHHDTSGGVAIIFGLSVMSLCAIVGGAIDFARWHSATSKVQMVMDSASLAGGRAMQIAATNDTAVAISTSQLYFQRMKPDTVAGSTPTFTVVESGTVVRGEIDYSIPTPFLGVVGWTSLQGRVVSETVIAAGGNAGTNLELSVMLDTTGSMAGQKIEDLKVAAKELIDIVVWDDQSQYYSKVALAPFSARVNVGDVLSRVTDVQTARNFGGPTVQGITCVTERTGPDAATDEKPGSGADRLRAYHGDIGNAAKDNSGNYSNDGACKVSGTELPEIMPLTSNKDALKARIDSLPAHGSTAGALGTAWAWYMLSPKWTGIWHGDSMPAPYSDLTTLTPKGRYKLQKVAVLMTDGVYNTFAGVSHSDGSSQAVTIAANAVAICNNMKAAGIKVYTIGFKLEGNALAHQTLRDCASRSDIDPPGHSSYFYTADSGSELRGAFRQIALQLSTLRIRM